MIKVYQSGIILFFFPFFTLKKAYDSFGFTYKNLGQFYFLIKFGYDACIEVIKVIAVQSVGTDK